MSGDGREEPEELLAAGRPLPRWVRPAGIALAVVVGGYLAVHALSGDRPAKNAALPTSGATTPAASHSAQIAPPLFRQPGGPHMLPAWPTARGACGNDPQLALVSGQQRAHGTGLTVLVGGTRVWRVDVDTGSRASVGAVGRGAYVTRIAGATAVAYQCRTSTTQTFSLGGRASALPLRSADVYQDGGRTYYVREATRRYPHPLLITPGRSAVQLPRHFAVVGVTSDLVAGTGPGPGGYVLLDARTGRLRARLPHVHPLAVGGGHVVSAVGCDLSRLAACTLRSTAVSGGATRDYSIPQPPAEEVPAVVSPDGRELAFALERSHPDRRYSMGYPLPPSDIAWLHLDTGRVDRVPGIELPGKAGVSLAFAPRSDWLVAALNAGRRTRLLAWRPGLAHPLETTPITSPSFYRAGLEVVRG